jgi:hypothetical protein
MAEWRFGLQRSRGLQRSSTPPKVGTTAVQRDRTTCEPNEEDGELLSSLLGHFKDHLKLDGHAQR